MLTTKDRPQDTTNPFEQAFLAEIMRSMAPQTKQTTKNSDTRVTHKAKPKAPATPSHLQMVPHEEAPADRETTVPSLLDAPSLPDVPSPPSSPPLADSPPLVEEEEDDDDPQTCITRAINHIQAAHRAAVPTKQEEKRKIALQTCCFLAQIVEYLYEATRDHEKPFVVKETGRTFLRNPLALALCRYHPDPEAVVEWIVEVVNRGFRANILGIYRLGVAIEAIQAMDRTTRHSVDEFLRKTASINQIVYMAKPEFTRTQRVDNILSAVRGEKWAHAARPPLRHVRNPQKRRRVAPDDEPEKIRRMHDAMVCTCMHDTARFEAYLKDKGLDQKDSFVWSYIENKMKEMGIPLKVTDVQSTGSM
jgi:hypothetical protein